MYKELSLKEADFSSEKFDAYRPEYNEEFTDVYNAVKEFINNKEISNEKKDKKMLNLFKKHPALLSICDKNGVTLSMLCADHLLFKSTAYALKDEETALLIDKDNRNLLIHIVDSRNSDSVDTFISNSKILLNNNIYKTTSPQLLFNGILKHDNYKSLLQLEKAGIISLVDASNKTIQAQDDFEVIKYSFKSPLCKEGFSYVEECWNNFEPKSQIGKHLCEENNELYKSINALNNNENTL